MTVLHSLSQPSPRLVFRSLGLLRFLLTPLVLGTLAFSATGSAAAQEEAPSAALGPSPAKSVSDYLGEIRSAKFSRNYTQALRLIAEAKQYYPNVAAIWSQAGQLYEQQNLLRLALSSYREARNLQPENSLYIKRIANLQNQMGLYQEAVDSYQDLEDQGSEDDINLARRNKAWLLYKLHRFPEAEANIRAIPPEYQASGTLMTLAIIYYASYNYDKAVHAFEQSIAHTFPQSPRFTESSPLQEIRNFNRSQLKRAGNFSDRGLIYYNYALLEYDFMHYQKSMDLNQRSLECLSFSSNELLAGELLLAQRKFNDAKKAFLKSQRIEEQSSKPSPLALLDLVLLASQEGSYHEGLVYLRNLKEQFDNKTEWMASYGTDAVSFEFELNKLRIDLYRGLINSLKWRLPSSWAETWQKWWQLARYRAQLSYFRIRKNILAYQVSSVHNRENNSLDRDTNLVEASDLSKLLSKRLLRDAQAQEISLIPHSKVHYTQSIAILEKDSSKIKENLRHFIPGWESQDLEEGYLALAALASKKTERYQYLLEAYKLNPASLTLAGQKIPISLHFSGSAQHSREARKTRKQLQNYLAKSSFHLVSDPKLPSLKLQIQWAAQQPRAYVLDTQDRVLFSLDSSELSSGNGDKMALIQFVNRLSELSRLARS